MGNDEEDFKSTNKIYDSKKTTIGQVAKAIAV